MMPRFNPANTYQNKLSENISSKHNASGGAVGDLLKGVPLDLVFLINEYKERDSKELYFSVLSELKYYNTLNELHADYCSVELDGVDYNRIFESIPRSDKLLPHYIKEFLSLFGKKNLYVTAAPLWKKSIVRKPRLPAPKVIDSSDDEDEVVKPNPWLINDDDSDDSDDSDGSYDSDYDPVQRTKDFFEKRYVDSDSD
jgi:hypothetical protein